MKTLYPIADLRDIEVFLRTEVDEKELNVPYMSWHIHVTAYGRNNILMFDNEFEFKTILTLLRSWHGETEIK